MNSDANKWSTTITNLLFNFRDVMVVIVPYMEKNHIGWKDKDAYDDWDEIASTLYKNLVVRNLQHADETSTGNTLAPYDLILPSYEKHIYVSVQNKNSNEKSLAFISFSTRELPFDHVKCVLVNDDGTVNNDIMYYPINECEFSIILKNKDKVLEKITDVSVEV